MEPEGARRIWNSSIEKHNLRYTDFYGDGDSNRYDAVKNVYQGVLINKLECGDHVQKRVGNRLRNLKKKRKRSWWSWKIDRCNYRSSPKLLWYCNSPKQK